MEDWTHERCGGARVMYAGTKVSTMTIDAPQRRHTKHGGVVVSVCGLRGGASLSSARASARLPVNPAHPLDGAVMTETQTALRALRVNIHVLNASNAEQLDGGLRGIRRGVADVLIVRLR